MYHINKVFLTAVKYVGHGCQVQGDFASDIAIFMLDTVQCLALISSLTEIVRDYNLFMGGVDLSDMCIYMFLDVIYIFCS